ncbi:MAG: hypothetical protein RLZZ387_4698 [Chloroflexota bacterium]
MISLSHPSVFLRQLVLILALLTSAQLVRAEAPPVTPEPRPTPALLSSGVTADAPALLITTTSVYLPVVARVVFETYPAYNRAFELEILRLINVERAAVALPPLLEHAALTQAARRHAEDMAVHTLRGHIGSDRSTPEQRMREEGYTGIPWTEASNFNYPTPQEIVGGWMRSPLHRDIVLDRTSTEIGVGYASNPDGVYHQTAVIDLGVAR